MEIRKSRHLIGACVAVWASVASAGLAQAGDGEAGISAVRRNSARRVCAGACARGSWRCGQGSMWATTPRGRAR